MTIKVTNTATGTVWTFYAMRKAFQVLYVNPRYIDDYCNCSGRRKFHSGVYEWCFINEVKGDSKNA